MCASFAVKVTPTEGYCLYKRCEHGGTCVERPHGYDCICTPQYTGPHCGGNEQVNYKSLSKHDLRDFLKTNNSFSLLLNCYLFDTPYFYSIDSPCILFQILQSLVLRRSIESVSVIELWTLTFVKGAWSRNVRRFCYPLRRRFSFYF